MSNEDVFPDPPALLPKRLVEPVGPRSDFDHPEIRAKYAAPGGKYYDIFFPPGSALRQRHEADLRRARKEARSE